MVVEAVEEEEVVVVVEGAAEAEAEMIVEGVVEVGEGGALRLPKPRSKPLALRRVPSLSRPAMTRKEVLRLLRAAAAAAGVLKGALLSRPAKVEEEEAEEEGVVVEVAAEAAMRVVVEEEEAVARAVEVVAAAEEVVTKREVVRKSLLVRKKVVVMKSLLKMTALHLRTLKGCAQRLTSRTCAMRKRPSRSGTKAVRAYLLTSGSTRMALKTGYRTSTRRYSTTRATSPTGGIAVDSVKGVLSIRSAVRSPPIPPPSPSQSTGQVPVAN